MCCVPTVTSDTSVMRNVTISVGFPEFERDSIVAMLRAYEAGLGLSLDFQGFVRELAGLPGAYAPPDGAFFVARASNGTTAGVVALRTLDHRAGIGELKRLFVAPEARGQGLGRRLSLAAIAEARRLGLRRLRLDTLPQMVVAQHTYEQLGFVDIANYNGNPLPGARFMELTLDGGAR